MEKTFTAISEDLNRLSPLEIGNKLLEYEFYSKETAEEIIDKLHKEFKGKDAIVDSLITPAFFNIFDNLTQKLKLDKYGVTPSRLVQECKEFNYDEEDTAYDESAFTTHENLYDVELKKDAEDYSKSVRNRIDDTSKRKDYRDNRFGDNKTIKSDYDGKIIYNKQAEARDRNFKKNTSHYSDIDHIIPLEKVYDKLSSNMAMTEKDIKEIANLEENYAIANADINRRKGELTNEQYIDKFGADEKTADNMMKAHKTAEKAMNTEQNKRVAKNLVLDSEIRNKVLKETSKEGLSNGGNAAMTAGVGEAVILFVKTAYFEINESIRHGIQFRLNATTTIEAFKLRVKRAMKYVVTNIKNVFSNSVGEFVKAFLSSLVSSIINMFTGIIKKAWDIVKKGFSAIVQAIKLLVNPPENMTGAQKADAIVKILATTVISAAGIALDAWLSTIFEKFPMLDFLSPVITSVITGLISALAVYLIDKIDIFGAKQEMRVDRINEVFEARVAEIKENMNNFNQAALEVLVEQKERFEAARNQILYAFKTDDYDKMASSMYVVAGTMGVTLEYSNTEEFAEFLDSETTFII